MKYENLYRSKKSIQLISSEYKDNGSNKDNNGFQIQFFFSKLLNWWKDIKQITMKNDISFVPLFFLSYQRTTCFALLAADYVKMTVF